jgi:U3 small nucleolar RNA-associated protein 19
VSALQVLMSLQKHLSTLFSASTSPQFHISHFKKVVSGLLICPSSKRKGSRASDGRLEADVREVFVETWFNTHDDVRWFFLREAECVLSNHAAHPNVVANSLSILERLTTFPTEPSELNSWWVEEMGRKPANLKASSRAADYSVHSLASHRAVFTRTWLTLLPLLERDKELSERALNVMHRCVMPHLTRPVLVMDWVGACVDFGMWAHFECVNDAICFRQVELLGYLRSTRCSC